MFSVFESLEIILMVPFVSLEFPEVFPELNFDIPHKILTRLQFSTDFKAVASCSTHKIGQQETDDLKF